MPGLGQQPKEHFGELETAAPTEEQKLASPTWGRDHPVATTAAYRWSESWRPDTPPVGRNQAWKSTHMLTPHTPIHGQAHISIVISPQEPQEIKLLGQTPSGLKDQRSAMAPMS